MGACISLQGNGKAKQAPQKIAAKPATDVTAESAGELAPEDIRPASITPIGGETPKAGNVSPTEHNTKTDNIQPARITASGESSVPASNTALVLSINQPQQPSYTCPQSILEKQTEDVWQLFKFGNVLEAGPVASTRLAEEKATGQACKCKSFIKARLRSEKDVNDVKWEVDIMRELRGHPGAPALQGVYEDDQHVHLVTELTGQDEAFEAWFAHLRKDSNH